jgi:hypothetical protein
MFGRMGTPLKLAAVVVVMVVTGMMARMTSTPARVEQVVGASCPLELLFYCSKRLTEYL